MSATPDIARGVEALPRPICGSDRCPCRIVGAAWDCPPDFTHVERVRVALVRRYLDLGAPLPDWLVRAWLPLNRRMADARDGGAA